MNFEQKYGMLVSQVNEALDKYVIEKDKPEGSIYKAMKYSLMVGGKRLRPVLALAVCEMLDGDSKEVMPYACAVEMIHTYSLIHDDLPAMDNDGYRRGKPTNHKVFGEAKAILAGDALLNYAFEIMIEDILNQQKLGTQKNNDVLKKVKAMNVIAKASGVSGMIGGQVVDIESEKKEINSELLCYMYSLKTGALIKAPILSSAILCSAMEEDICILEKYAEKIGLAFQIKDDLLDVEGSFEDMGKVAGSDAANRKKTFVSVYGHEESKKTLLDITAEAHALVDRYKEKGVFLKSLGSYIVSRKN